MTGTWQGIGNSVAQWCLTLCNPMDCRLPVSSVYGILQAKILEWDAISSSRGSSQHRDRTCISCVSCTGKWILYHSVTWEALAKYWVGQEVRLSFPIQPYGKIQTNFGQPNI